MIIDLGGITAVEIFAGYLQQNFVSGQFQTISTPTFGLTGYWNPIAACGRSPTFVARWTTRRCRGRRLMSTPAVDWTLTTTCVPIYASTGMVITRWPTMRRLALARATNTTSTGHSVPACNTCRPVTFSSDRMYQFIHRTSNQFNSDYDQNIVMLRLGARL